MLFGNDRTELRRAFARAWQKRLAGAQLGAVEAMIADVVAEHPEYHALLGEEDALEAEFVPEDGGSNPFLHMGLHMAIREQVSIDRPPGARAAFAQLAAQLGAHQSEHVMSECLAEVLWTAQRAGGPADEQAYLEMVRRRARGSGE